MIPIGANIDDLMKRHLELAVRLHDAGHTALALETALAALQHEPPSRDAPLATFLVHSLLTTALETGAAAGELQRHLAARPDLREAARWWVQFFLACQGDEPAADRGGGAPAHSLAALNSLLSREPSGVSLPSPLPLLPGCARCVIVESSGQARLTRIHLRWGAWSGLDQAAIVGQAVPGSGAALDAARQYLARSGCEPIDNLQAEVLVEGLFRPVQGESLSLAIFIAAVSARLGLAVPADWAFTGAIGAPAVDTAAGAVMPVNEIEAKLAACARASCTRLMAPAHLLPGRAGGWNTKSCALVPAATTVEAIEAVWPAHRLREFPPVVGWREYLWQFFQTLAPRRSRSAVPLPNVRHRAFRLIVPWFFALMLTERWLVGDYLVPEYYWGVQRPTVVLAVLAGALVAALTAATVYASLRVVDRLLDRGATVNWWVAGGVLLAGCALAWLPAQVVIRDPSVPPPRGLFFEHRTLQGWKDTTVLFLYALIFFVSPYTRVRLAEGAAAAGRLRWAREILEGRRWTNATFPTATIPLLVVIASVALMGLGYLDWRSLTDPSRAGSGLGNGPWKAIHIIGRAYLYLLSCIVVLWWIGRATGRVAVAAREDSD
jgi:hypothetical protein